MINIFVQDKTVRCNFAGSDSFSDIIEILKVHRCRFDVKNKNWSIPLARYETVLDALQDIDVLQMSAADERDIADLFIQDPELRFSSTRIVFHPELLKYPPIVGKPPYEDFQLRDILRALNRNRYGLFLDMGLGKAYISCAIITHLRYYGLADKVVLISSNIGAPNMVHELKKFIAGLDPNEIVCLPKVSRVKKADREIFTPDKKIVITNYSTFRYLSDHYHSKIAKSKSKGYRKPPIPLKEWLGGKPGILLLDESHILGDPGTEQTKKALMHVPFFEYRYEFTGTPADKPEKLYTQIKILDPALVRGLSYQEWLDEYNETGNQYSSYAINPEKWKYDKLQKLNEELTKNYVVYRKKEDCLDLPPNIIKKLYTELTPAHRYIYQSFITNTLNSIKEKAGYLSTRDILNSFPYLQMALDNPSLLLNHSDILDNELIAAVKRFDFKEDHSKVDLLLDILDEKAGDQKEKGIVWIYHPDTARKLEKLLAKYSPLVIIGETDEVERMNILDAFRTQEKHRILIASIPVLNTSVTLTMATFQVYFERVYNFAQYWQSMARIDRIGKSQTTLTYVLITDYTIDVALDINLSNKDLLNSKLLSKEFLSLEDWKLIFNASDTGENLLTGW